MLRLLPYIELFPLPVCCNTVIFFFEIKYCLSDPTDFLKNILSFFSEWFKRIVGGAITAALRGCAAGAEKRDATVRLSQNAREQSEV